VALVIVIGILVALAWVFLALPARRRQRSHAEMQDAIVVGDEIITAGGMHGVVREAGESELRIEIAPGVVVTLDRRAVAAVAQELHAPDEHDPNNKNDPPAS
jgi:preprotein translocase subunit YajC